MLTFLVINPADNVGVALQAISAGEHVAFDETIIIAQEDIAPGHKMAIHTIPKGSDVIKYGFPIGSAQYDIPKGCGVHTHNIKTKLADKLSYTYTPKLCAKMPQAPKSFEGYIRKNGKVGIRNEIWILPTVGCVNSIAKIIELQAQPFIHGSVDGIYAFCHPYGCSQLGNDYKNTQKILAGLAQHPNAGGVLILGLGCENNNIAEFKKMLGSTSPDRIKFLNCQDCNDEVLEALTLISELVDYAATSHRTSCSSAQLCLGLKCGGSDGFSGISANPLVGTVSDLLITQGGSTILTEVPEMFGAESILMGRCSNETIFNKTVQLINRFKDYFIRYNQTIYENPSPGNKSGGISTLEDKSLGCIQKGGSSTVTDVLDYGEPCCTKGLNLLQSPGNDLVATTALVVSGAQLVLFTTGRGTPFGCPVPTVKISSNTKLYQQKPNWIDFNAGSLLEGVPMQQLTDELYGYILAVASGTQTVGENQGIRDIAIWKDGVTL